MNWEWLVSEGLIQGDPAYYADGKASAEEINNAVETAYLSADEEQRKQVVDMAWESGGLSGDKSYWYENHGGEVQDFAAAVSGVRVEEDSTNEDLEGTGTGARFGIPDGAQVWRNSDTGQAYLVYMVPGTEDDPAYMKWYIPDDESLQSFFGPDQPIKYDKDIAGSHDLWTDAVSFGTTNEIPPGNEAPFAAWTETLETESAVQPWILDDDYQKLFAMAIVEGRSLTEAELASTNWYSTHSVGERNWLRQYHGDPSSAQQTIDDNRLSYGEYMRDAGMGDVDDRLINYMADQVSKGLWTDIELQRQVQVLSDPYFEGATVDPALQNFIDDNSISYSQTRDQENEVRNTVERWLGTNFGKWDDSTVSGWANSLGETSPSMSSMKPLSKMEASTMPVASTALRYEARLLWYVSSGDSV